MEIQVNKLRELMDLLKPAVPRKSTLPITAYIRLGEGKAIEIGRASCRERV